MKRKHIAFALAGLLAVASLTACGDEPDEITPDALTEETSATFQTAQTITTASETEQATETLTSSETAVSESETSAESTVTETESVTETTTSVQGTTEPIINTSVSIEYTDEDVDYAEMEKAMQVAELGYRASLTNDLDTYIKYANVDFLYYISTGEWLSDEELKATMLAEENTAAMEEGYVSTEDIYSKYGDFTIVGARHLSAEEIDNLNIIAVLMGETEDGVSTVDYFIEDAYDFIIEYEGDTSDFPEGYEPDIVAIKVNGEWKMDTCLYIFNTLYEMFDGTSVETVYETEGGE